eukprot:TRINITY_DN3779_c0_g1_i5.p1 TRINITY_DN3779_c0_g1~~TRINITY_DN3779_c0_g1_i5.p1  ORF type:complete len:577 (-),score=140.71 TRINITY_DN3779_c0_g1_i5:266-1996(-)
MADTVQALMEGMVPELEDLRKYKIFNKEEIRQIVKKRRDYEYRLKRRAAKKEDFLMYAQYEMNLEKLRRIRKKRLGIFRKKGPSEFAGVRRIHFIFDRGLRKFKSDMKMWMQAIDFAMQVESSKTLNKLFARALSLHPREPRLWKLAATWEFEHNANITAARVLFQRAIRLNPSVEELWVDYFACEVEYLLKARERFAVMATGDRSKVEDIHTLNIPQLVGESEADANEDNEAKKQLAQELANREAFLGGALLRTVFKHAIKAIPDSFKFRLRFISAVKSLDFGAEFIETIYESLLSDFGEVPECWYLYAEEMFDLEEEDHLQQMKAFYETAIERINSEEMWTMYADHLLRAVQMIDGDSEEEIAKLHSRIQVYLQVLEQACTQAPQSVKLRARLCAALVESGAGLDVALAYLRKASGDVRNNADLCHQEFSLLLSAFSLAPTSSSSSQQGITGVPMTVKQLRRELENIVDRVSVDTDPAGALSLNSRLLHWLVAHGNMGNSFNRLHDQFKTVMRRAPPRHPLLGALQVSLLQYALAWEGRAAANAFVDWCWQQPVRRCLLSLSLSLSLSFSLSLM